MLKTTYVFVDEQTMLDLKELLVENFEILVNTFVSDGSERIERLGVGVSNKDMESVRMESHALKGSSQNVGADRFAQQCAVIECQARDNVDTDLEERFSSLQVDFQVLCEEVRSFL